VFEQDKIKTYGSVTVTGKTFSGSPDTTLMNTIRMVCYNRYVNEYLVKLRPNQYKLWVKGDDVVCAYDNNLTRQKALDAYKTIFTENKNALMHGLGQIAKFYKLGDITDIDFCSTNTIATNFGYKIIRKLTNLAEKQNFSQKATYYNEAQLAAYNRDQIVAARKWTGNCELFNNYMLAIHKYSLIKVAFYDTYKKIIGKKKKILALPIDEINVGYLDRYKTYEEHLKDQERISDRLLTFEDVICWLSSKSGREDYDETNEAFNFIANVAITKA